MCGRSFGSAGSVAEFDELASFDFNQQRRGLGGTDEEMDDAPDGIRARLVGADDS